MQIKYMESNSISLFSKNLNNFKQKSVQNWFYNNDNINYFNQRENTKKNIPNRNKTKLIVNMRKDNDLNFIQGLIDQGIKTYIINGRYFNHKEYSKIIEDIRLAFSKTNEIECLIFDFKGPDTIITKVENIFNKKETFIRNQIVKISFDDPRIKYERDNRILIDKKISNLVEIGDIIEIIDSTIVLKIIAIDKNRKNLTNKYEKLLNIMDNKNHSKFDTIHGNNQKFGSNSNTLSKLPKIQRSTGHRNLFANEDHLEKNETNDKKIIDFDFKTIYPFNTNEFSQENCNEEIFFDEKDSNFPQAKSSPYIITNNNPYQTNSLKKIHKSKEELNTFEKYERKEDDIKDYKIIYEETQSDLFKMNEDPFHVKFNSECSNDENGNDNCDENLPIIREENSKEYEFEDFLNRFHLNDDEEFPLEGKYFDNIYQEKLKTKQEKMDILFHKIIKRQKTNNLKNSSKANKSHETLNEKNLNYKNSRDIFDIVENEKLKFFDRKERIKSSTSLERISNRNNEIICEVIEEGIVNLSSSLRIRNKDLKISSDMSILSAKDIIDINKCFTLGINIFSFIINNAQNVSEIKDILGEEQLSNVKIFARLETQESLINFDSILNVVDGIILNHGFKFYNIQYKDIYLIEVYIIEKCKQYNKPFILQTNSIKSININKPVIFKVSILDFALKAGVDAIIIKDQICEINDYLNTLKASRNVIAEIERVEDTISKYFDQSSFFFMNQKNNILSIREKIIMSLMDNTVKISHEINADLIVLFTDQIHYAKILTSLRPNCIIACPTNSVFLSRFLRLYRGVIPFFYENLNSTKDVLEKLIERFKEKNMINKNLNIILTRAYLNVDKNIFANENNYNNGVFVFQFE